MMQTLPAAPQRLLVGLGSPYRGDDAVGPLIVQRVAQRLDVGSADVRVAVLADPSALLDVLPGIDFALIVDAVSAGRKPGTLVRLEAGADTEALPAALWASTGRGGTHALGLAGCIELARVLGRLPARLLVIGVEAAHFELGAEISAPVIAAVDEAVETITHLLRPRVDPLGGGC